jgi:hypothetical protein
MPCLVSLTGKDDDFSPSVGLEMPGVFDHDANCCDYVISHSLLLRPAKLGEADI